MNVVFTEQEIIVQWDSCSHRTWVIAAIAVLAPTTVISRFLATLQVQYEISILALWKEVCKAPPRNRAYLI